MELLAIRSNTNIFPAPEVTRAERSYHMKTMLDILKERLPEGLEIVKVKVCVGKG